jgi:hypothetical protein
LRSGETEDLTGALDFGLLLDLDLLFEVLFLRDWAINLCPGVLLEL